MAAGDVYRITGITSARIGKSDGASTPAFVWYNIKKGNEFNLDPSTSTLTYEGNGSKEEYTTMDGLKINIKSDYLEEDLLSVVQAPVTTGLSGAGESIRWYFGSFTDGVGAWAIQAVVSAIKIGAPPAEAATQFRIYAFNCGINQKGKYLDDAKNIAKSGTMLDLSAYKVTTDVINAALPGVPPDGAYYSVGKLV